MVLLFTLIFAGFIVTLISEEETPLNSIVIVSNAFTSNGYKMYKFW